MKNRCFTWSRRVDKRASLQHLLGSTVFLNQCLLISFGTGIDFFRIDDVAQFAFTFTEDGLMFDAAGEVIDFLRICL